MSIGMNTVVYLVAAEVVVGLCLLVVGRREKMRTEAMAQACAAMGFGFEPSGELADLQALAEVPLFSRGHSRAVRNVMTGRIDDAEVKVFDYRYTTGGGQHAHTSRQTVALLPSGPGLPDFVLAPENVFHRIGQVLGYQDIDFDESPEFSAAYLLRGEDETAIRAAFRASTLSFLSGEPGWTVESRSGHLAIYRSGKRCKPEDLQTFVGDARRVRDMLRESQA